MELSMLVVSIIAVVVAVVGIVIGRMQHVAAMSAEGSQADSSRTFVKARNGARVNVTNSRVRNKTTDIDAEGATVDVVDSEFE